LLSSFEHPAYYQAALKRGAAGYLLKTGLIEHLGDAIRAVAAGQIAFPAHVVRGGGQVGGRPPSRRELEVIHLVAEGASNDEIPARLRISPKTVDSHLRALFDRYGVVSRTGLAMHAVGEGWLRTSASGANPRSTAGRHRWMIDEGILRSR
jgi:DNA-binding NarL/FixJ family response regulator